MTRRILSAGSLLLGVAVLLFSLASIQMQRYSLEDAPVFMGWPVEARVGIALGAVLVAAGAMAWRQK